MNEEQMKAWVANPNRADTLPSGFYEPAYRKGITGAALVVRGVVYFRDGYTSAVRAALVKCFEQYNATIVEYAQALARVRQEEPPKNGPLRWFYSEGEQPAPIDKAPKLATLAKRVPSDEALVVQMTSADHKLATGFYNFGVFTVADWKAPSPGISTYSTSPSRGCSSIIGLGYSKRCLPHSAKPFRRSTATLA